MSERPIPAERIHLKMVGYPQKSAGLIALVIAEALQFCAQPETFAVFSQWARQKTEHPGAHARTVGQLNPRALADIEHLIAAGAVVDMEAELQ